MAIKAGTENKRNVIIAAVLFCIVAYLAVTQLMGPSTPTPPPPRPTVARQGPDAGVRTSATASSGPSARLLPNSGLDPALHLEKLALSESIEYEGTGRNIFSPDSAPVQIPIAMASARPHPTAPVVPGPPPVPQPPTIDLHYFGYSTTRDGKKEAFLLHGDDVFEAAPGEIVNHRYKVVSVDIHSIQITDLSYNNTQTLQITN